MRYTPSASVTLSVCSMATVHSKTRNSVQRSNSKTRSTKRGVTGADLHLMA